MRLTRASQSGHAIHQGTHDVVQTYHANGFSHVSLQNVQPADPGEDLLLGESGHDKGVDQADGCLGRVLALPVTDNECTQAAREVGLIPPPPPAAGAVFSIATGKLLVEVLIGYS